MGPSRSAPVASLPPAAPADAREALEARYDLRAWRAPLVQRGELAEAWYALDVLDWALPDDVRAHAAGGRSLDVGAKTWAYLAAQVAAVPGRWDAVELTGRVRRHSLLRREQIARRRLAHLDGCRYVTGCVTSMSGPYRLVTWFLPFLTPGPVVAWGLDPDRELRPAELLAHVWSIIEPGGTLLVTNQGERESELQGELFADAGIAAVPLGPAPTTLSPFRSARWAWRATRGPASGDGRTRPAGVQLAG